MTPASRGALALDDPRTLAWLRLESTSDQTEFLAANQELSDPAVVDALCEESGRLAKSDLGEAIAVAESAEQLATLIADERGRGRAFRARANATHLKGKYHEAADLYAKALEHFQAKGERRDEAVTRSSALHNLIYLGDYDRAEVWAGRAREIFEELGDHLRLARLDLNYANLLYRNDRWEEALGLYESAYEAFLKEGDAEDLAACLSNQATCLISLNRYFQALTVYKMARQLCVERDWPLLLAEVDYNIAYLYFLRGDYTQALEQYQTARQRAGALGDQLHLGLCDLDQSEIYIELNLVSEAVRLASRAYERFVLLGLDYEAAKALSNLAIGNSRQGKTFLALDLLTKSREIFSKEGNLIWPAVLDLYRAILLFGEGRSFEAARLAREARAVFESAEIPSKSAACEILLAKVSCDRGEPKAAIDAVATGLGLLRSLNLPALSHQAYLVLGQAEEARGNRLEATRAYESAQVWLERMSGHRQPEELKIGFSDDRLLVYESLVSLTAARLTASGSGDAEVRVLELAERAKARRLANLIAFRASALPAKTTSRSALVGDIRSLREELNWYYRQIDLGQMGAEEGARNRVGPLRESSRQQEQKLVRTLREVQLHDQEFGALQDAGTVELEAIQAVLPPETLLVEYYVARGAVFGAVLGPDSLHVRPLSLVSRTQDLHRDLQFQLSKFVTGEREIAEASRQVDRATLSPLKSLHEELIVPLEGLLDQPNLVFVPDGHMHYLPFHALFDGAGFLGDDRTVSYSPSASAYQHGRARESAASGAALMLDATGRQEAALSPLVAAFGGLGGACDVLIGEQATREALVESGGNYGLVHLALGSNHREDNPMFSTLEFGDSGMSLFDLYGLELNADLVILTGCGAGLDSLPPAAGLLALAQGLLYAGSKAVALNLWNPDEVTSVGFWQGFYERLGAGEGAARALQAASSQWRQAHPHPFHWAPAVLIGAPD